MPRIALIGCGNRKIKAPAPAREMYKHTVLVPNRILYMERYCDDGRMLSGMYGVVELDQVITPYNIDLKHVETPYRREWSKMVVEQLDDSVGLANEFHILAGRYYWDYGVRNAILEGGGIVVLPEQGLTYLQLKSKYESPKWRNND